MLCGPAPTGMVPTMVLACTSSTLTTSVKWSVTYPNRPSFEYATQCGFAAAGMRWTTAAEAMSTDVELRLQVQRDIQGASVRARRDGIGAWVHGDRVRDRVGCRVDVD